MQFPPPIPGVERWEEDAQLRQAPSAASNGYAEEEDQAEEYPGSAESAVADFTGGLTQGRTRA